MTIRRVWTRRIAVLAVVVAAAACDDPFASDDRPPLEGSGSIVSLVREDHAGQASAFDMTPPTPQGIAVEAPGATGTWDVALGEGPGGLELIPASAFRGQGDARVAVVTDRAFAAVTEAPASDVEFKEELDDPIRTDAVYVVRSRRLSGCFFFSKLRPIEVDAEAGIFRFEYLLNQNCGDRSLEPEGD